MVSEPGEGRKARLSSNTGRPRRAAGGPDVYLGVPDGLELHTIAVKSLVRGFEILEEFRRRRHPLTAHDLQVALRYPQSSTRALLVSMAASGYLGFDRTTKSYFPTPRVALLGDWIDSALFIHTDIISLMSELNIATRETITLATQQALRMQLVHVLPAPQPLGVTLFGGQTMSLFNSSIGAALLSSKSDEELADLVKRFNHRRAQNAQVSLAGVIKRAASIRANKFCAAYGSIVAGIAGFAMPLPSRFNEIQFVICVSGPEERLRANEATIIRQMREAIRRHLPESRSALARPGRP